jgi:hypothetical protein
MKSSITIIDEHGRQVFGLDNEMQLHLYRRGDRVFPIGHGLSVKILCDLPNARDAYSQESGDRQTATPPDVGTTMHRIYRYVCGLLSFG